ncbi:hypothetical protein BBJ28_00004988 [Nothophytophthora sp. Chile5]|nr:hypothetical protein BBJ28_00004988 [Nothophytophthora sp. Chile5]
MKKAQDPSASRVEQKPTPSAEPDAHVTWDEETIARHDLERGTRMKIDEPNTPYHYYGGSEMEAEDQGGVSPARSLSGRENQPPIEVKDVPQPESWGELETKLLGVQDAKKSDWDSSDDENSSVSSASSGRRAAVEAGGIGFATRDAEGKKLQKDPKFAEKRKMHYNEFERVRAWKLQHAAGKDEKEEEEEEEDKAPAPAPTQTNTSQ